MSELHLLRPKVHLHLYVELYGVLYMTFWKLFIKQLSSYLTFIPVDILWIQNTD